MSFPRLAKNSTGEGHFVLAQGVSSAIKDPPTDAELKRVFSLRADSADCHQVTTYVSRDSSKVTIKCFLFDLRIVPVVDLQSDQYADYDQHHLAQGVEQIVVELFIGEVASFHFS